MFFKNKVFKSFGVQLQHEKWDPDPDPYQNVLDPPHFKTQINSPIPDLPQIRY